MINYLYASEWVMHAIYLFVGASVVLYSSSGRGKGRDVLISAGYFAGVAAVFLFAFMSFLLSVDMKWTVPLAVLLACVLFYLSRDRISRADIVKTLVYFLVVQVLVLLVMSFKLNIMSFDSYRYVFLAKHLAVGTYDSDWLVSYSLTLPLLQSVAIATFGVDVFNTMLPASVAVFLVFSVVFLRAVVAPSGWMTWVVMISALVSFASCFFFFFASFYLMPNLLAGVYLTVAVASVYFFSEDGSEPVWLYLFFIMLIMFSLMRVEGFVFSVIMLPFYLQRYCKTSFKLGMLKPYYLFLALVTSWFVYLMLVFPTASGFFYTKNKLIMLLGVVAILVFLPYFLKFKPVSWVFERSALILLCVLVVAMTGACFVFSDRVGVNLTAFYKNIYWSGFWGKSWFWIALPFVLVAVSQFKESLRDAYLLDVLLYVLSFILLLFLIFFFREYPLRAGFGDSSNRMILHVYPTIMLLVVVALGRFVHGVMLPSTRVEAAGIGGADNVRG